MDPTLTDLLLQSQNQQLLWQCMMATMQYNIAVHNGSRAEITAEIKEEQKVPTPIKSSSISPSSSSITLWQFLLEILDSGNHCDIITWTNQEGEFKFIDAEAVARMWGERKPNVGVKPMTYDKMSRALRFYYDKNIIQKVKRATFTYRFVGYPDNIGQTCSSPSSSSTSPSTSSSTSPYTSSSASTAATRLDFCIDNILKKSEDDRSPVH